MAKRTAEMNGEAVSTKSMNLLSGPAPMIGSSLGGNSQLTAILSCSKGGSHQAAAIGGLSELVLLDRTETQGPSVGLNQRVHVLFKEIAVVDPTRQATSKHIETAGSDIGNQKCST